MDSTRRHSRSFRKFRRVGGNLGGKAPAKTLTADERRAIARRRVCLVRTSRSWAINFLFMRTRTHLVMLNNQRGGPDFEGLQKRKTRHLEPKLLSTSSRARVAPRGEWLSPARGIARSLVTLVAATSMFAIVLANHVTAQERAVDGDPVDLFTGLHTREHDDIVLAGAPEIRLTRSYRNRDPASRAFGIGTSHSYDLYLVGDAVAFTYVDLILKDGGRAHYVRTSPGSGYTGAEFLHTSTPSPFFMSRLRWNGQG